jgi:hypothetical protein
MPWGLVAVAAFSWVVYRRAANAGRSSVAWVVILWLAVLAGASVGLVAGLVVSKFGVGEGAIPVGGVCGMLVAAIQVMRMAGAPAARPGA